jgi:branched-chain amino acid transport system ATP-binding protein
MTVLLEARGLGMRFGGLQAVDNLDLTVYKGEILAIIGPNGAGKTTVFNCLTGFYRPTSGDIRFEGQSISRLPSHRMARLGIMRTFQHVRLFRNMTVLENLLVAQHRQMHTGFLAGLLRTGRYQHHEQQALDNAHHWLGRVGLDSLQDQRAGALAYGQQRRLEIARCMVANPQLLMLDEPAAGLNPRETAELKTLMGTLRADMGVTLVLIEHDMKLVMGISDRVLVLNQGRHLVTGTPETVRQHPEVIRAYLGEEVGAHAAG